MKKRSDSNAPADQLLDQNTESGFAIWCAAVLDALLERLLLARMPMSNKLAEDLFGNGPLGTFSAKINLSRALDLVDAATHRELHAIKAIRNAFAHAEEPVGFDHVAEMRKLSRWREGADPVLLYGDAVRACEDAIRARTDQLVYEHAVAGD